MQGPRDDAGFDAFFENSWSGLQAYGYVLTGSIEAAQDLAQETLLRTWRHWDAVSGLEHPEAWTRQVLHNLGVDRWRRTRRRRPVAPPATTAAPSDDHLDLARAMQALPRHQARSLLLHDGLGMTVAEIARELSVPEGTVKSWLSRSRKAVAERLTVTDRDAADR